MKVEQFESRRPNVSVASHNWVKGRSEIKPMDLMFSVEKISLICDAWGYNSDYISSFLEPKEQQLLLIQSSQNGNFL